MQEVVTMTDEELVARLEADGALYRRQSEEALREILQRLQDNGKDKRAH